MLYKEIEVFHAIEIFQRTFVVVNTKVMLYIMILA
jgi:hypothetical protein